jgi:hypothetical protein
MKTTLDFSGEFPLVNGIPVYPIYGSTVPVSQYGVNTVGDVLVNHLADGTDINEVWADLVAVVQEFNKTKLSIVSLLSYETTATADAVGQGLGVTSFEEATEFGVPKAVMTPVEVLFCGFTFKDWDLRTSWSWKFLRSVDRRQLDATVTSALQADSQLMTGAILRRLFKPTPEFNEFNHTCWGLWNGTSPGPPSFAGKSFPDTTTHYLSTGNVLLDSLDIEDSVRMLKEKGYGLPENNSHILILANPTESLQIQAWRAGKESRGVGSPVSTWDFIPSSNSFPYLTDKAIVGPLAPTDFNGLAILGSLGPTWLFESHAIPAGWVIVTATSGPGAQNNPVGVRVHPDKAYQGLRLLPGNQAGYPLVDGFYQRGFGTGIRHRGAAVCLQCTTNASYAPPPNSSIPM